MPAPQLTAPPRGGRVRVLAALGLALAAGACAHPRTGRDSTSPLPVQLHVDNHSAQQMRLFVHHDGQSTRIGEVAAAQSQAFVIPARLIGVSGEMRVSAEPIAAFSRYVSETVIVHPGSRIVLTLEHKLDTSSLAIRE